MATASIIRFDNCVAIESPAHRAFNEAFKAEIPSSHRMWDGNGSLAWVAWAPWIEKAIEIAKYTLNPQACLRVTDLRQYQMKGVRVKPPPRAQIKGTHDHELPWKEAWVLWLEYATHQETASSERERLRQEEQRRRQHQNRDQDRTNEEFRDFFNKQRQSRYSSQGFPPPGGRPSDGISSNGGASTGNYRVLCVTNDAPREVVTAAYRALAKLYHPDSGGDEERQKKINTAYAAIRKSWS